MERVNTTDANLAEQPGQGTGRQGIVELLGEASSSIDQPLYPPGSTTINLRSLCSRQLVKILNSTPMGKVLSSRQLLRDKKRGDFDRDDKSIDLIRYTSWLRHQREQRMPKSQTLRRHHITVKQKSKSPSPDEIMQLLEKQEFRCALTGQKLTPDTATLDHILPVCRKGPHTIENAQVILKEVNRAKGTMTNEEFVELCVAVARHANRDFKSNSDMISVRKRLN